MLQLKEKPRNALLWERFLQMGLPTKECEVYRYVGLKELYSRSFSLPHSSFGSYQANSGTLVFVNGSYCPQFSHVPKPLVALPLSEASVTYGSFLNSCLQKTLKEEKDPFAVLNGAYCGEGLFLYLPPKSRCEIPIKIIHFAEGINEPTLLNPRIHLVIGKEAEVNLFYSQTISAEDAWVNTVMEFVLEEKACLSFTLLSNQGENVHDFLALRANLKKHSAFKSICITNGGATSRQDYCIRFLGAHAKSSLYGAWNLKKTRQHHVNVLMDHQEPACESLQKFKGVVSEASLSSFEGKIYVHSAAQKTEAYQMNHNLILDEAASAHVKPNLEIFADDVKASHGATVGLLDDEHLFYLRSRGLSQTSSRALLITGFSREIIDLIDCSNHQHEALNILK